MTEAWQHAFAVNDRVRWQRGSAQGVVTNVRGDRVQVKWDNEVVPRWHDVNTVFRLGISRTKKETET